MMKYLKYVIMLAMQSNPTIFKYIFIQIKQYKLMTLEGEPMTTRLLNNIILIIYVRQE
jgi:hypothetical protein